MILSRGTFWFKQPWRQKHFQVIHVVDKLVYKLQDKPRIINSTSHIVPTIIQFAFKFKIKEWILVFCWDCVCLILFTENISWLMLRINKLLQESKYQSLLFQAAFPRKANVSQRRSSPLALSFLLEISRVLNHAAEDTLASVECAWNHGLA